MYIIYIYTMYIIYIYMYIYIYIEMKKCQKNLGVSDLELNSNCFEHKHGICRQIVLVSPFQKIHVGVSP